MLFFHPQDLNWYLYCDWLYNLLAVIKTNNLRRLNLLRVKAVLLLHNLDNLGQFELLLAVVAVQIRLQ